MFYISEVVFFPVIFCRVADIWLLTYGTKVYRTAHMLEVQNISSEFKKQERVISMTEAVLNQTFAALYAQKNPTKRTKKMVDTLALELMGETWVWPEPSIQIP